MSATPVQLALSLPHRAALGERDFIISGSCAAAVGLVDQWPHWPSHAASIVGPAGAGKSHLANVWRARTGGAAVHHSAEASEADYVMAGQPLPAVVEDLHLGVADEQGLFHLLNIARETGSHVLLTARTHPGTWDVALPDLRSRLRSFPVIAIEPPDDALLRAVLVKLFADRQLPVADAALDHLALHMERSMAFALRVVDEIDRLQLESRRAVTRNLAKDALARLASGDEASDR